MRVVLEANRITDFGNWFLLKNHFVSHEHTFGYYIVPQSIPSVIFKKVIEMGTTYIQVSGYWSYWYIFRVMIIYILDSIFNKIRKNSNPFIYFILIFFGEIVLNVPAWYLTMFPKEYRIQTHFWYYNIVESSFHYLEIDLKFHRADGRNSSYTVLKICIYCWQE